MGSPRPLLDTNFPARALQLGWTVTGSDGGEGEKPSMGVGGQGCPSKSDTPKPPENGSGPTQALPNVGETAPAVL